MKTRIFVSYTSKDPYITEERLKQVESKLAPFASVFIDRIHNKCGRQCRVNFELFRCDIMIQLVSTGYMSKWSQKELLTARKKGKPVLKISMDELLNKDEEQVFLLLEDFEKKSWPVWGISALALLVCVGICFLGIGLSYYYVSKHVGDADLLNARGVFGDSWGGVNAIISAFAFAGVIVTLFLQNRDLNLQRKEMERQREEFEKENETLKYQRFENLFYNMLDLQQEIVAGLRFNYQDKESVLINSSSGSLKRNERYIDKIVTGRDVFRFTFDYAEISLEEIGGLEKAKIIHGYRKYLCTKGLAAYDDTWIPTYYDHYFRHLYKIIQFVDRQGFPFDEAYNYVSMLRGTLSRYELVWIYYNALNPSFENFKKLIEKYSLLKSLREDLLTTSYETEQYFKGLGLSLQQVRKKEFTARDFEYFLTDNKDEKTKYHISAFWKKEDLYLGQEVLNNWRAYIDKEANKVIEKVK